MLTRLLGCQDLFEDALLPAVTKRDSFGSSPDAKYRTLRGKNELSSKIIITKNKIIMKYFLFR